MWLSEQSKSIYHLMRKTRLTSDSDGAVVGALVNGLTLRSLILGDRKHAVHVLAAGKIKLLLAEVPAARNRYTRLKRKNKGAGRKLRNFLSRMKFIALRVTSAISENPPACIARLRESEKHLLVESSSRLMAEFVGLSFSGGRNAINRPAPTDEEKLKRSLRTAKSLTDPANSKYHKFNAAISDLESQVYVEPVGQFPPGKTTAQNPAP